MFRKAIGAIRRLVAGIFGVAAPATPVTHVPVVLDPVPVPTPAPDEPAVPSPVPSWDEPLLILGTAGQRAIFNLQMTEGPDLPHGRPVELVLTDAGRRYLSENGLL